MRPPLEAIRIADAPPCLGLDIYRRYRAGELSERDYYVMTAAMVAKCAREEKPRPYIAMASQLREYVMGRVMNTRDYDQGWSAKLGEWVITTYRSLDHNTYMSGHLLWAKEKCEPVALTREVGLLEYALEKFAVNQFPSQDFDYATRAQVIDSSVRERKMKEKV